MASNPVYEFYAELTDYEPKIWRRFQVMNNITMAKLGYILMTLFEMQATHLFCFDVPVAENYLKSAGEYSSNDFNKKVYDMLSEDPKFARKHIALPDDYGFPEPEADNLDASKIMVKHVLSSEAESMTFSYDFGDGWEIKIILENILKDKDLPGKELPRVLDGFGYGIIEDCGGPHGLEELARVFKSKKGERYQELSEWLGLSELDLDKLDLEDMNFRLKKVPRIYRDAYELRLEPTDQSMDLLNRRYKRKLPISSQESQLDRR
ncbi:plasmid pRiA4b ORF-3 family protein [Youngiibacter fragilis]|uniref:Plasmid pRiA4b Orf3-like domain-containing protein n=1 Tax=Youngiibacter fragilis 232.1 TaxID=994573 RepID=V7I9E5_9CLOT|nr:plasmid pRiA4b ORF-3 family protein [Youngiibacter fragilis]ETA81901.1 hypothetical protein T472_0203955 [Youngiibacter fragilis 232.1]